MTLFTLLAILFADVLVLISVGGYRSADLATSAAPRETLATPLRPTAEEPEIGAHSFLVRIIGENRPLLKRREWKRRAPASLSKLLTALVANEHLPENARIVFSPAAKSGKEDGEKMSPIPAGEILAKEDVLKVLLVASANDAAHALAERLGGEERFRTLANEKLKILGLENSRFSNPGGLDEPGHFSTAEDLAGMAEYIWNFHPQLWEITRMKEAAVFSESGREYKIKSTNELLEEFPAILGGKTGFTDNAGEALLLLYPLKSGKVAVILILGSENRFEDGRKIIRWLES